MAKVIPVKVAVRVRPLSSKEVDEGCQSVVRVSQIKQVSIVMSCHVM